MMFHTHDGNNCYSEDAEVKALFFSIRSTASNAGLKSAAPLIPPDVAMPVLMDVAPIQRKPDVTPSAEEESKGAKGAKGKGPFFRPPDGAFPKGMKGMMKGENGRGKGRGKGPVSDFEPSATLTWGPDGKLEAEAEAEE